MERYLTPEQKLIVSLYNKILGSEKNKDFKIAHDFSEEQIENAIINAVTKKNYDNSDAVELEATQTDRIVIHGVHQFTPLMLRVKAIP